MDDGCCRSHLVTPADVLIGLQQLEHCLSPGVAPAAAPEAGGIPDVPLPNFLRTPLSPLSGVLAAVSMPSREALSVRMQLSGLTALGGGDGCSCAGCGGDSIRRASASMTRTKAA